MNLKVLKKIVDKLPTDKKEACHKKASMYVQKAYDRLTPRQINHIGKKKLLETVIKRVLEEVK